jgi:hypothetical protein
MARPPAHPLQQEVAAAVRGAHQGGAKVARITINKAGTIVIETTLAPVPPEPTEEPGTEPDPVMKAGIEHMQRVR